MKQIKSLAALSGIAFVLLLTSCDKTKEYDVIVPPVQAHFLNTTVATYYVTNDPNSVFKIPVGLTKASSKPTVVTVTMTSPTNAVSGTQYTLPTTTVTIPAGKVVDSLTVKGIFSGYATGRVDTLTFTIQSGDAPASDYNKVYKLILRKYCAVVSTDLVGNYTASRDYYQVTQASGASYTAAISNWTSTGATTATVLIKNLGATLDIGFGPFQPTDAAATGLTAMLDWTNPANFTVTLASQPYVASLYTYGASTISGSGTFSSCDRTFNINYVVRVSVGTFSGQSSILK